MKQAAAFSETQNVSELNLQGKQHCIEASAIYRFINRNVCGQVITQALDPDVSARQGLVATGAWVEVLRAVLDQKVLRPVAWTGPSTALHLVA